jgi:hypothetical protein
MAVFAVQTYRELLFRIIELDIVDSPRHNTPYFDLDIRMLSLTKVGVVLVDDCIETIL